MQHASWHARFTNEPKPSLRGEEYSYPTSMDIAVGFFNRSEELSFPRHDFVSGRRGRKAETFRVVPREVAVRLAQFVGSATAYGCWFPSLKKDSSHPRPNNS